MKDGEKEQQTLLPTQGFKKVFAKEEERQFG